MVRSGWQSLSIASASGVREASRPAPAWLHDPYRCAIIRHDLILLLCVLHLPVQIVQLELHKFKEIVLIQKLFESFGLCVAGKAEMPDAPAFFCSSR